MDAKTEEHLAPSAAQVGEEILYNYKILKTFAKFNSKYTASGHWRKVIWQSHRQFMYSAFASLKYSDTYYGHRCYLLAIEQSRFKIIMYVERMGIN